MIRPESGYDRYRQTEGVNNVHWWFSADPKQFTRMFGLYEFMCFIRGIRLHRELRIDVVCSISLKDMLSTNVHDTLMSFHTKSMEFYTDLYS